MIHFFKKIGGWIGRHKIASVLILAVIGGVGYAAAKTFEADDSETLYVLGTVEKGSIVSAVTGTGQVSASDQINLKTKASGDLISINVKEGQEVRAGALIAQIDSSDANDELESARISYEDLTTIDSTDLKKAERAVTTAETSLGKSYSDAIATLTSGSISLSNTLDTLEAMFKKDGYLSSGIFGRSSIAKEMIEKAESSYYNAREILDAFQESESEITTKTDRSKIEDELEAAIKAGKAVADSAKKTKEAVSYIRDRERSTDTLADDTYTSVTGLTSEANDTLASLITASNDIVDSKEAVRSAEIDLTDLKNGPDDTDIRTSQLSIKEKQTALSDYSVYAPFAGVIASVDVTKGDSVSSGTEIATLITKDEIAEISLNEVDAAKVAIGNKATLTFDAIDDLSIAGVVEQIDLIGTVSQGVVNYTVKIAFATDDPRIKPGMTVSASIITAVKDNVLVIPTSAIKTSGDVSVVDVIDNPPAGTETGVPLQTSPREVEVTLGLSDDESTEIISGLLEGETYVVRTISSATAAEATQTRSLFGGGGTSGRATGGFGR